MIAFAMVSNIILALCGILALWYFARTQYFGRKPQLALPPGPKPLPIIGNLFDLPPKDVPEFEHWLKYKNIYGPITTINVVGQKIIIIHDRHAASNILERNSLQTSGRLRPQFGSILCGFGSSPLILPYNSKLRQARRNFHKHIGSSAAVAQNHNIREIESRRFLIRLLYNPKELDRHIKTYTAATILKMTYGYSVRPTTTDPLVVLIEKMMQNMSIALSPATWLVDFFPAMKCLPESVPGMNFKKTARHFREINTLAADIPYSFVLQQMAGNQHRPSFVSKCLEEMKSEPYYDQEALKWSALTLYGGGSDTMVETLRTFVLAMIMFPDVQLKAQEEIDRVVGTARLPQMGDQHKLPYTCSLLKETLRWNPVSPMGMPHLADEDVVFNNYLIPKGAILLPAIRWFCHDPTVYADPSRFDPARFLQPRNEPDPTTVTFGFGRRSCPGQRVAEAGLFIAMAQVLATFDIRKGMDEQGMETEVKMEIKPGLVGAIKEFDYNITLRNMGCAELIRASEAEYPWDLADADLLDYQNFQF